ncbi:MAG: 5-formyltetrahydrofolate cyclo-ligase [Myxococcota bacterium]|nr:5-formyltetrahydrofolate cyclo-ligase [Myxococcota bacterium]
MTLEDDKARLRRNVHFVQSTMGPEQVARASVKIADRVIACPEFASAETVALYAATEGEIDVRAVFEAGVAAGKCCVFPRCLEGNQLEFSQIEQWDELVPGRYGIYEPPKSRLPIALSKISLALVPGLAFDLHGGRLGRGGGYYDRTFIKPSSSKPKLMGVAHSVQVFDVIPVGEHDRRVDLLVTEATLIQIAAANLS